MEPDRYHAETSLDETWVRESDFRLQTRRVQKGIALDLPEATTKSTTDFASVGAVTVERQLLSDEVLASHRDGVIQKIQLVQPPVGLVARILLSHIVTDQAEWFRSVIRLELDTAEIEHHALITTPANLEEDLARLERAIAEPAVRGAPDGLPTIWKDGSAGVLLHEAIGHPAGEEETGWWPAWLSVVDDPSINLYETTLGGDLPPAVNLLKEAPKRSRRAGFRDHDMPRLSNLIATANDTGFETPSRRIEISMAHGGDWDPLSDEVRVLVSLAHVVADDRRTRLEPFVFSAPRRAIADALLGARGEPVRYPGVFCSEHGQRLPVGTFAPEILLGQI